MISVGIYNIQYGKRLSQITTWVVSNSLSFDILCLQEFPYDQINKFIQSLKPHIFEYRIALGFIKDSRQYGQITLYNTKRIKFLKDTIITLSYKSFWEEKYGNKGNRSALITIFTYKTKRFTVINTHLLCLVSNSIRRKQIEEIVESIETDEECPTILLGDFNYTSLFKQKKFLQFMTSFSFKNAHTFSTNKLFFIKHQIDYVFYKNCQISDIRVRDIKYSDHFFTSFNIDI